MKVSTDHFSKPIAREGFPFILISLGILAGAVYFMGPAGGVLTVIPLFVINFFRNPKRQVPSGEKTIVSPADGKIVRVEHDDKGRMQVSIFMNVFDVHLNRIPVKGTIKAISYYPGKFLNADMDKASLENERNTLVIETSGKKEVRMTQVAGLVARRIVCYAEVNDLLESGVIFGLIRFGSRVDLDLPGDSDVRVSMGERVRGGESVIGYISS
jgi:phosphatidylserine decarboxylase